MQSTVGVLLVNLGTPNSPSPKDVYKYLIEFLTDERVIDTSWLKRQLLVRGVIVPSRYRQSAKAYQAIWMPEGSPLKVYGYRVKAALQSRLGDDFRIELAMRYCSPSIPETLDRLKGVRQLIVLPFFPHYASATTGSVHQKVMEELVTWDIIPETVLISHYETHPGMIQAFCSAAAPYTLSDYDHILFSFHGLPKRLLCKADRNQHCLKTENCCAQLTSINQDCYSAQCHATARSIAKALKINSDRYSISFQSRLGKEPWLEPYTSEVINNFPKQGKKKVLVFCPSFICDCLETTYEIGVEYAQEFKHSGGIQLDLVPGLNEQPQWIDALIDLIKQHIRS